MVSESFQRREAFLDKLRLALIANDPSNITKVFPQWGGKPKDDVDIEDTEGSIEFEEFDPKKAEDILAQLLADTSGTMTMADVSRNEGWM